MSRLRVLLVAHQYRYEYLYGPSNSLLPDDGSRRRRACSPVTQTPAGHLVTSFRCAHYYCYQRRVVVNVTYSPWPDVTAVSLYIVTITATDDGQDIYTYVFMDAVQCTAVSLQSLDVVTAFKRVLTIIGRICSRDPCRTRFVFLFTFTIRCRRDVSGTDIVSLYDRKTPFAFFDRLLHRYCFYASSVAVGSHDRSTTRTF
jgi:hypothetical protein